MIISSKMQVELFHLMFLRLFSSQIEGGLYAVKGGCNLRFFFNSFRYSEDLDIDIQVTQKDTLEKKVTKILASSALLKLLLNYGVTNIENSAPKQTQTTQRWKILLHGQHTIMPINTKIEFSRRQDQFQSQMADVGMSICQRYRLPPSRLSHYGLLDAITQKISALAYRSLTQARDIFDLYHLLHIDVHPQLLIENAIIEKAEDAICMINFKDYYSQVVTFLEPENQIAFNNQDAWNNMTQVVLNYLEKLKK